ncbi:hypothetical protein DFQ14_101354 [Halopolyspora algeriensis]|uniref:Uncharacterized protein n=1 Tax=Halopolyspora algeriensis TaxID=1500506 RepID=A0A368VYI5_9ACTN|nr:hypothetical protein [Halopolyspora algeriensis]RCW47011.1 hypothetical protein DFQ14_101354 [Halopolyspora algeriensis]TQM48099.1 hypothetical protein FHU43_3058 [Halopolyspora algeriensis]
MARDVDRGEPAPGVFGRIDPFCWLPVGTMFLTAVLLVFSGILWLGIGIGSMALVFLLFDVWVNRPKPWETTRRSSGRAAEPYRGRGAGGSSARPSGQRVAPPAGRSSGQRVR